MSSFTIRVGYGDVKVVSLNEVTLGGVEVWGCWKPQSRTIELEAHSTPADHAAVLLHEMLHAIWSTYDFPDSLGDEEAIVAAFSGPLASLIRDNPSVIAKISASLNFGNPMFGPTIH